MPPQARRHYSAAFKHVILFVEENNIITAEREFGVSGKCVPVWQHKKDRIFACAVHVSHFTG